MNAAADQAAHPDLLAARLQRIRVEARAIESTTDRTMRESQALIDHLRRQLEKQSAAIDAARTRLDQANT